MMRKVFMLAASAAIATVGLSAPAAQAKTAGAWYCPPGAVCFFQTVAGSNEKTACRSYVDRRINCTGIRSVTNNGNPQRGADHAYLYDANHKLIKCMHYGSEGKFSFNGTKTITSIEWGGEC
ncbi:hypothetical protein OIE66_09865 [Nonomuraea sp. NBC_01738]|uniref:hypothetical protein n=1 Tax=Nonomuraea sp. NBC_01738 TaxID=2976003 RepID=UPI002E14458D|nr:hypothetical protein OIE66_09865 [Nonomuraea sp. NBC_01738]